LVIAAVIAVIVLAIRESHFKVKEVTKGCFAFATATAKLRSIAVFRARYFNLKGWCFMEALMAIIAIKVNYCS